MGEKCCGCQGLPCILWNDSDTTGNNNSIKCDGCKGRIGKYIRMRNSDERCRELYSLGEDLAKLEKFFDRSAQNEPEIKQSRDYFFCFFKNTIIDVFCKYMTTKEKAWSKPRNIIVFICTAVLPALSALILRWATGGDDDFAARFGMIVVILILVLWVVIFNLSEWQKMRSYRETWVRHSLCYRRLRLALCKFLSSVRSHKDLETFMAETYSVLSENYNQFQVNMSGDGSKI